MRDIDNRLDKIQDDLTDIKVTLARNTDSLEHHIERTDSLQTIVEYVQRHVHKVEGAMKLLGVISLVVGISTGIYQLIRLIM